MSAPTGNKYAEKWTLERTLIALSDVDSYSLSNDCLYLGHALYVAGYYDDVWRYWMRKWKRQYEVISRMKTIMQRFEVRLFEKMAKKEIPERVGMFALKHHYGWGREPRPDEPFEDLSGEDQELITEPIPKREPKPETSVKSESGPTQNQPTTEATEEPMTGQQFMLMKKKQYNALHPTAQILSPAAFFDGEPPSGMPAILFDGGYFLKC